MKSDRSAMLLASIFLIAASCLASCASVGTRLEPPDVTLVNIEPLASTAFEQRFAIEVRLVNPNEVPLVGDGMDVTVELNGQRLTRALSPDPFTIPRLGDGIVRLVGTTTLLDLFRQAAALPEATQLEYRLSGRVLLAGSIGWLGFEREGNLMSESFGR